jgi:large subunit ribosomal protein L11
LKAAGLEKGSGKQALKKAGTISKAKIREIAERKLPDLNTTDLDAAARIIEGSARSLGIDVK